MKPRPKASAALTRPAMPAPTPPAGPARTTKRVTVDLDDERYLRLRQWALEAGVPASLLLTALLDLAEGTPRTRSSAEATAAAMHRERYARRGIPT